MGVAKVTLNGSTLMDTTGMTVTSNTMVSATTALDKAGNVVTGNLTARSSADLDVDGSVVTVPPGVYAASASVDVFGGGGSSTGCGATSNTLTSAASSISFTGLSSEPSTFVIIAKDTLATGAAPYKVASVVFDGTDLHGQIITNTNNAQVTYDNSSFSKSYSNGTLTVTSTGPYFQAVQYQLIYTYGTAPLITTKDVQVGSGATSVTFTDLPTDNALYFSCIFKSNFGTSSGYQRVIWVVSYDGVMGMEMDSSAKFAEHWTVTKSGTSLTITSNGTNQGGYFHQPGYYQLTYVVAQGGGSGSKLQDKNVTPTESQQVISADSSYLALSTVTVAGISSNYVGTNITRRTAADLTANLSTVTAPAGYYSSQVTRNVTSANAFAPAVTLNAATGVVTATNTFASAYYAASTTTSTLNLTLRSSTNLTASGSYISGPSGYYSQAFSKAISAATFSSPGILYNGGGLMQISTRVSTAGYTNAGTVQTTNFDPGTYLPSVMPTTYTPTTTNQTIASRQWLTGTQTILGDANLVASNIASGVSIFGVTGTHEGGGSVAFTATILNGQYSGTSYSRTTITYNNTVYSKLYSSIVSFTFTPGDSIAFYGSEHNMQTSLAYVTYNNSYLYSSSYINPSFIWSLPAHDIYIYIHESGAFRIYSNQYDYFLTGAQPWLYFNSICYAIPRYLFASNQNLTTVSLPNTSLINISTFYSCSRLMSVYIPICETIFDYAFCSCESLTNIDLPMCTSIRSHAFQSCASLTTISVPMLTTILDFGFHHCGFNSISLPAIERIYSSAFQNCTSLTNIYLGSNCTTIGFYAFSGCWNLATISGPGTSNITTISSSAFNACRVLQSVNFPALTSINYSTFVYCSVLSIASFKMVSIISNGAFMSCYNLISLYLTSVSSVPTLAATAFNSTPIGGYSTSAGRYGSVFVPASLYNSFITATNWATISSRIVSV